ncbi:MAG: hypothetical protein R3D55_23060 [Chloroflexota bacterium]
MERTTTPRQPNVRRLAKKVANKAKSREKKLIATRNPTTRRNRRAAGK